MQASLSTRVTNIFLNRWNSGPARWVWVAATVLLFFLAPPVHAQFGSSLAGTVLDPTGAAIPGASVVLTNSGTQQTQTVITNDTGFYRFGELAPGKYSIEATANGFKKNVMNDISVAAETPRNVDVHLQTGGTVETVTINAGEGPELQTADASIGTTIGTEEVTRLPIVGGDPYELLRTAPGITGTGARAGNGGAVFLPNGAGPGGSKSGIFQTENGVQISADGQRQSANNFMIDGVSVNSLTHGGNAVVTPNEEAVGQMTVVSTSYDAADGRNSGAQIKVVTKNGTNSLHGGAFFLYDQPGLNAYSKFIALPQRVENAQRTWAASLGGPAVKDKLFWFASWSGFSVHNSTLGEQWVETPDLRALIAQDRPGGISAHILSLPTMAPRVVKVLSSDCSNYSNNQGQFPGQTPTGGLFCQPVGGGIDVGSPTAGGASQLGVYPRLNYNDDPTSNTYTGGGLDGSPDIEYAAINIPSQARGNQWNLRGDWNVTARDLVAGVVYFTKLDSFGTSGTNGARPNDDVPFKPLNSAATAIYIHTFSPSWLNEFRANGTRFAENGVVDGGDTVNWGIPYINVQSWPVANPQFGVNWSQTTPAVFAENTYELRDMVTHTWGAHTVKLGIEVREEQDNDNLSGQNRPIYAMQGMWSMANDAPIFEQISANPHDGGLAGTQRYFRSKNIAVFGQHDWKVSPNLTINTGLRWEYFEPLYNKGFAINYPELGPPGMELAGMRLRLHNHLWDSTWGNLGPKFGVAYTPPTLENKLVIRSGFAMAYNHLDVALFNPALEDGPNVANYGLCCGTNAKDFGTPFAHGSILYAVGSTNSPYSYPKNPALATGVNANGFPNPFGGGTPSVEVYGALSGTRPPLSYLYSLETQYQIAANLTATLGYAGSTGHHYARLVNQIFLYNTANSPVYGGYFAQTDSNQNYNALNAQLRQTMRRGLAASLIYTYARSMDQVSNGDLANSNGNQTNPANNATEWGPSDYDAKHRFTATAMWEVPHFHVENKFASALVNGWQANGIFTWYTGFPYTPVTYNLTTSAFVLGSGVVGPTRPLEYFGGAKSGCSNDLFINGSDFPNRGPDGTMGGENYFNTTPPENTHAYVPGIGRNSFRGPCYHNIDLGVAKQFGYDFGDHHTLLRLQANFFNAFNILQLSPFTNGNANAAANINNSNFGIAQSADAGRVIELSARFQF
jgi:Carboxypeptidase regulatory-like domain/TonB dependent receptor